MGKKCALKNCRNYQKEPSYGCDVSFHGMLALIQPQTCRRLPRNRETRKKWLDAIPAGLLRGTSSNMYICGVHFTPESFQPAALGLTKNMLRKTAIPSIFDDTPEPPQINTKKVSMDKDILNLIHASNDVNKVNFVNASDTCVYVITKTEAPVVQSEEDDVSVAVTKLQGPNGTCDVGVQVCLPTDRERDLQRKLYKLQKQLERRETRISSIMTDFKTLMDMD